MAAVSTVIHDPYVDGLGKGSNLGMYFLRRVRVAHTDSTTVTVTAAELGAQAIMRVVSIVPRTAHTAYVSTDVADGGSDSVIFTASNAAAEMDYFVLCKGI